MGDYILIIDSDTRVPKDCLLDSVSELEHTPQCGILQHASGVMNVRSPSSFTFETSLTNLLGHRLIFRKRNHFRKDSFRTLMYAQYLLISLLVYKHGLYRDQIRRRLR